MTPTQISNLALDQLPAGTIVNLDETSVQARACARWYNHILATILQQGPWRFSRKLVALAGLDDSDRPVRWLYRYAKPSDLSMVLRVYDETLSGAVDYDFIGEYIYTNTLAPYVEYIGSVSGVEAKATALFRSAVITALAAAICMPITKSSKRQKELSDSAENALQRAQAFNINEGNPTYGDFIPETLRGRMGLTGLEALRFEGPEAVYPDFDPLSIYQEALDD